MVSAEWSSGHTTPYPEASRCQDSWAAGSTDPAQYTPPGIHTMQRHHPSFGSHPQRDQPPFASFSGMNMPLSCQALSIFARYFAGLA